MSTSARTALRLQLQGRVQGLGVRPAVARLAHRLGVAGTVRNTLQGLEIVIEGAGADAELFRAQLLDALPAGCAVHNVRVVTLPAGGHTRFEIARDDDDGPLATLAPTDTAVCGVCLAESRDPDNRRHGYPLISCASCGPRYSLIRQMPYERDATSLADFPLCRDCDTEFRSPDDRRYHAQTTACPDCGPNIRSVDADGRALGAGDDAVSTALAALRSGQIVAVRGIGGYQLLCDAADETAVARLRARKSRPAKPLAALVESAAAAAEIAILDGTERGALSSTANPIVVVRTQHSALLAPSIHPGLNTVGLMLPTTALHDRLVRSCQRPLVCTSGNREGDPLEYEPSAAERNLAGIADLWLHHDRPIERPIDDSVVRIIAGRPVTLRLARGLAPLPLDLPSGTPMLALGGQQKSALAWCNGRQCVLGPHLGDLESLASRERFLEHVAGMEQLYRFVPETCVHDAHPGYFTTRWAAESRFRRVAVQHHHAHVAAGMLEHGLLDEPVLGVAFDGTGLGPDGTIWGGEFLLAHGVARLERVAHLRAFALPGGEAAIREPWRVALAVLHQCFGRDAVHQLRPAGLAPDRIASLVAVLERPHLGVTTTSAGRLFDAAACLILGISEAPYDGAPAMRLEDAAEPTADGAYPLPLCGARPAQLDWRPLFRALMNDCRAQVSAGTMAMRFHRAMAAGITAVVRAWPGLPVVLSGGVFQNRLLTELVVDEVNETRRLCLPGVIPPNDGGLAAGQLAVALAGAASID